MVRMRFDEDDEQAFSTQRDELGEQFAAWLTAQEVAGDPNDAGLLMDWKWGYGDGILDFWTVADVQDFLLDWCPRKLSAAPQDCAEIPLSVAAFMEFLASTGLLAPRSDPPSAIRRFCEQNTKRFVREMGNPVNFGMAKSLFGGLGGLPLADDAEFPGFLQELIDDDEEAAVLGPVRLPDEQDRRDAIRAARVPRQLRLLAEYCAPPGRPLTGKGNLRLADARHLVDALETGDDLHLGGFRKLGSAEDLPTLSWLFELALAAGVVRRKQGKLVAVARFAALDESEAYEKVVRAAVVAGLNPAPYWSFPELDATRTAADESVVGLLAELLDADAGVEVDSLIETMTEMLVGITFEMSSIVAGTIPEWVLTQVQRLTELGAVTADGGKVVLTAAGVPVAIELVREAGVEVLLRPDPVTADAASIAELLDFEEVQEWRDDAGAWLAAQPDRAAALDELVAAVCVERREPFVVLLGLNAIGELADEEAVPAVRRQVGGPHDGQALHWLLGRAAIDPATIDPLRFVSGLVDILAAVLDAEGPQDAATGFGHAIDQAQQLELLDRIWRLRHPRLADVLQAIGAHYPVKAVAKAARRAAIRHRSWLANPPAQGG